MTEARELSVLAAVACALASSPLEEAWSACLQQLARLGLREASPEASPWLCVERTGERLCLAAGSAPPSAAFRDALCGVLELALTRAEEHAARRSAEERCQLLSAASFEGLVFHVDGEVFDVNERFAELVGYPRAELMGGQTLARCVIAEDLPDVYARLAGGYEGAYVVTGVRRDGSRFRAELQAKQGQLGERPVRVAAVRDVTERERTQALLRETEARMRTLVETTFDLTVFSRQGTVVDVAGACEAVLGYTREQMIGQHIMKFTSPRAAPTVMEKLTEQRTGFYRAEGVAQSGELVPLEIVGIDSSLNGQPVRVSAMRDLRAAKRLEDERLKLQRDLERSQRMDSLGVLAGGIAHDFNNLLMGVMGYAELLKARMDGALDRELLQGIIDAGQRAATLTAQLLAYAGRKELGPRTPIDLAALLSELRVLLDATLSKKAKVSLLLEEPCVVLANRATLTQVAMNLLTNASDALQDEPGQVTVRVSHVAQGDFRFSSVVAPPSGAGFILLEVSDTGCGMDEATQAHIFEPFFTTKPHGHGLGLAACMGIVSSHGGALHVESTPGLGSTFSMLLPAHAAEPAPVPRVSAPPPAGDLRVLVVDDEPLIRTQLRHALRLRGYRVEEAADGEQALALISGATAQPFAIMILDVTMPVLSGLEVLRRLRAVGAQLPIVLSSGYHDAALDLDPASFQGFLIKPYTLSQLFDVLHAALERSRVG